MAETPDIIYTQQFVAANVQYLDYSEREEAVDLLNDFDVVIPAKILPMRLAV